MAIDSKGGLASMITAGKRAISVAHVRNLNRYLTGGFRKANVTATAPAVATAMVQVIKLMEVRDPQQVMLEVRVAEISKKVLIN